MYATLRMEQIISSTCVSAPCSDFGSGVVAIAAWAGGISALIALLRQLTAAFPLPIVVAQHLSRRASNLDWVLSCNCRLKVSWATNGERPNAGQVYLVPPGMLVEMTATGLNVLA